jgi:hypothetical protein
MMSIARAALAVALIVAPAAVPHPKHVKPGLNACTMVPARVLDAAGVTAKCWHGSASYSRYGMSFEAAWNRGNPSPPGSYLGVSIMNFYSTSSEGYKQAREGLSMGRFKEIQGIGTVAYESLTSNAATGGESAELDFVSGRRIVSIGLDADSPIRSFAPLDSIGKAIAKKI